MDLGKFTLWATNEGVVLNGVQLARIEGRGMGIIAERHIKADEEIVNVPTRAILSTARIPQSFKDRHKGSTVHGLLASFLAFGDGEQLKALGPWSDVWPSLGDLSASLPMFWTSTQRVITAKTEHGLESCYAIPPSLGGQWSSMLRDEETTQPSSVLAKQAKKLRSDLQLSCKATNNGDENAFIHKWLVVNTRCFYFDLPMGWQPQTNDDKMVLCPFMDFFNHADSGCNVSYNDQGYTVSSDRDYEEGEEIYICYGRHDSDTLLVDYGFLPETNIWDALKLDHLVLSPSNGIDATWQYRLNRAGYHGNYTLDSNGVCHRTQVAARTKILSVPQWRKFVAGLAGDSQDEAANELIVSRYIQPYIEEARLAQRILAKTLSSQKSEDRSALQALLTRWGQVLELLRTAQARLHVA